MTNFPFEIIMKHIKNIEKKAGGVLLYIRDSIQYQNMPVIQMKQDFIEKIFKAGLHGFCHVAVYDGIYHGKYRPVRNRFMTPKMA